MAFKQEERRRRRERFFTSALVAITKVSVSSQQPNKQDGTPQNKDCSETSGGLGKSSTCGNDVDCEVVSVAQW